MVMALSASMASAESSWVGPNGESLPFADFNEAIDFLRTAEVIQTEKIGEGINNPLKVLLEKDGVTAHAIFRDVRVSERQAVFRDEIVNNFRDDAIFEVAAFELASMIGIESVPPTVPRRVKGKRGSLQLWIESAMSEKKRLQEGKAVADMALWRRQNETLLLFDNLIANDDRNLGNILHDPAGKVWFIDHTRAFRTRKEILEANRIQRCDRVIWEKLLELTRKDLDEKLDEFLTRWQITSILERRDLLVVHLQKRIDRWGEDRVLVDAAPSPKSLGPS
jgi:hypothetical protein